MMMTKGGKRVGCEEEEGLRQGSRMRLGVTAKVGRI